MSLNEKLAIENWADIPGYEGLYQVSDHGKIKRISPERILKTHKSRYEFIQLHRDGKPKGFGVHRLVAMAFIGNDDPSLLVLHCDGNPLNNHVSNLRYGTAKENSDDRLAHGTMTYGEQSSFGKLKNWQAVEIYKRRKLGESRSSLAKEFGVSYFTISNIDRGRSHKQIVAQAILKAKEGS